MKTAGLFRPLFHSLFYNICLTDNRTVFCVLCIIFFMVLLFFLFNIVIRTFQLVDHLHCFVVARKAKRGETTNNTKEIQLYHTF